MLLGVLDIGSNSAQLQVFEARSGAPPLPTHAVKAPTLLGEAFGPDGAIEPTGVDRVVEAVNHAMSAARRFACLRGGNHDRKPLPAVCGTRRSRQLER